MRYIADPCSRRPTHVDTGMGFVPSRDAGAGALISASTLLQTAAAQAAAQAAAYAAAGTAAPPYPTPAPCGPYDVCCTVHRRYPGAMAAIVAAAKYQGVEAVVQALDALIAGYSARLSTSSGIVPPRTYADLILNYGYGGGRWLMACAGYYSP